jgi:hypothetical protein
MVAAFSQLAGLGASAWLEAVAVWQAAEAPAEQSVAALAPRRPVV